MSSPGLPVPSRTSSRIQRLPSRARLGTALLLTCSFFALHASAQEAPSSDAGPEPAPIERHTPAPAPDIPPAPPDAARPSADFPVPHYDPSIFLTPIPADQMAHLVQFDGAPAHDLWHDKQFRHALKGILPNGMFHYGRDMPLDDALDMVISGSRTPVRIRDGRYLLVSGAGGPYLAGRGFVWIDLRTGIALGGFFFHPTNGEPTPSLAVFSRQVKEDTLSLGELPPAFVADLTQWSESTGVPPVETTYFLTGSNKRVLLEHDEDFCSPADGSVAPSGNDCEQMNADAADLDETAAYYLDQVNYATNATAWMIGPDQVAFVDMRERTCGSVLDPFGCRIRLSRRQTHLILRRPSRRR